VTAYYIDEAAMDLPEGPAYLDRSVNILEIPGEEGTDLGLMIERTPIPEGKSLRDVARGKDEAHARELRGFTVIEEGERLVGDAPALWTRARWRHPKGPIYNVLVHVGLDGVCLTFTTSCRFERAEACDRWLEALLSTVRFRAK
jgi:hypothetical protein